MLLHNAKVVILAGGAARRMGSPKALLRYSSRENFLDRILAVYRAAGVDRATIVWAHSARRDPRVLHAISHPKCVSVKIAHEFHDDPDADRLASVLRGLRHADGASRIFLQDVDRPFITTSVITSMLACKEDEGYAAPRMIGHAPEVLGRAGHPLLLSSHLVTQLQGLSSMNSTLRDVLQPYPCTLVPVASRMDAALPASPTMLEININTPAEYRLYFPSVAAEKELVPA